MQIFINKQYCFFREGPQGRENIILQESTLCQITKKGIMGSRGWHAKVMDCHAAYKKRGECDESNKSICD